MSRSSARFGLWPRCSRRPWRLDNPWRIVDQMQGARECAPKLLKASALAWPRAERQIQGLPELGGEISALASQGREVGAQAPCPLRRSAVGDRIHPSERLVEDDGERVKVGRGVGFPALGLF